MNKAYQRYEEYVESCESDGVDPDDHAKHSLKSTSINKLRKFAKIAGVNPSGDKTTLATRLSEAGVFRGPIGDRMWYQERDGQAVVIAVEGDKLNSEWYRDEE